MTTKVWRDWPLILGYHSISDRRHDGLAVKSTDFGWQMGWLHRHGYQSLTLAEYVEQSPQKGDKVVIITFDDGYRDNYTHAFPTLKRYGFVATIFLVSDYVDTDQLYWWDRRKLETQHDAMYQILTWNQIAEMAEYGIEFGSHTCTHPNLTTISDVQCWQEINQSRIKLQARLNSMVSSFCYPHGYLSREAIHMVGQAGYSSAVVTPRWPGVPLGRYTMRRISIYGNNGHWHFRLKMMSLVRRYYERFKLTQNKSRLQGFDQLRNM